MYTCMCGIISDSWDSSSAHSWSLTVTSAHLLSIKIVSRSEAVWAGRRVCEDSRWIIALAISSTSLKMASSFTSMFLWWLQVLWNSSMTELRAELAPAAHWSLWDIRNCWLWIFSITLLIEVAKCSDSTCKTS